MTPQGLIVVTGGDAAVRVWDLAAGGSLGVPLEGHRRKVLAVAVGELHGGRQRSGGAPARCR